jgi:hypothetical protein
MLKESNLFLESSDVGGEWFTDGVIPCYLKNHAIIQGTTRKLFDFDFQKISPYNVPDKEKESKKREIKQEYEKELKYILKSVIKKVYDYYDDHKNTITVDQPFFVRCRKPISATQLYYIFTCYIGGKDDDESMKNLRVKITTIIEKRSLSELLNAVMNRGRESQPLRREFGKKKHSNQKKDDGVKHDIPLTCEAFNKYPIIIELDL